MPIMEAGLFAILLGMAFIFMLISFKFGALFKLFSAVVFFALAVVLLAGYDVAFTTETTTTNPSRTITDTRFIVNSADDQGNWLGWLFVGLGLFNGSLFFVEMIAMGKS